MTQKHWKRLLIESSAHPAILPESPLAEQVGQLNADLSRSNAELDAFAYIASHDLKEPLRGLHNYATFLQESYSERMDTEGQHKLSTLVRPSPAATGAELFQFRPDVPAPAKEKEKEKEEK